MAIKEVTATVMTPVRNGYSSSPSGYDVGGPGDGSNYNNSIYMTFPGFGLEAGSTIDSATLSYTMTGWDWRSEVDIFVQACASAGTAANQVACTGARDTTQVPDSTLVSIFAATNTARQMNLSGKHYLKMYCANGNNRKNFSSSKAKLTVNYTPPAPPGKPVNVTALPTPFEGELTVKWTKGAGGTNNPITGHEVQYRLSSDGAVWGSITTLSTSESASATTYSVATATLNSIVRGRYLQLRVGSKSQYASTVYSDWSEIVRKNQKPATLTNVGLSKACYAPLESDPIRITFDSDGDADNAVVRYEAALKDSEIVIGTQANAAITFVNVSTVANPWTPGAAYQLRVRARDELGAVGDWSALSPLVMVGLPMFVRPEAGSTFKRAVSMKIFLPGMGYKTVKSIKAAPVQGAISKTVF